MIEIRPGADVAPILRDLGLQTHRPVLVLIGGAGGLDAAVGEQLGPILEREVFPLLSSLGAVIVDGGTDAGLMRIAGEVHAAIGAAFPLIGVSPRGKVIIDGAEADESVPDLGLTALEPHHTHHLVVPGGEWGDESATLLDVASALAGDAPLAVVLVNGGDVALRETMLAVGRGHHVLVVEGTGRLADQITGVSRDGGGTPQLALLVQSGRIELVSAARLASALESVLGRVPGPERGGKQLSELIDRLNLTQLQKELIRARWLDQLAWMTGRAKGARISYQRLHLVTVIGGVTVPALVSFSLGTPNAPEWARLLTFFVSLLVAITAALEEVFHFGDVWRQYRSTAEALKSEGWEFIFLTGSYADFDSHASAYRSFTGRVEGLLRQDVSGYFDRFFRSPARPDRRTDVVV